MHRIRNFLWDWVNQHFGRDDSDTLVWVSPSLEMNSTLDPEIVKRAYDTDRKLSARQIDELRDR